jgi:NAD(P)-dependent dehydrogenase (short-subunit alcohol dehydrogenase family)
MEALITRHAFITGGGSGVGLAIAKAFVAKNVDVTIAGRDVSRLEATGLNFVQMDVTNEDSITSGIKKAGHIDIFVANAGAAVTAPALKTSRDLWDQMIAVNLTSTFLCARAAIPAMADQGWGRFIAIASTAALKGYPYTGAYAAAKHGVLGWIRTLALELALTGVTANAVCPGFTDTPLIDRALDKIAKTTNRSREEALAEFVKANPMRRLVATSEVANTVLWLASEEAASINGQAIAIDGGETA